MRTKSIIYRPKSYTEQPCGSCGLTVGGPHVTVGNRIHHVECFHQYLLDDVKRTLVELKKLHTFADVNCVLLTKDPIERRLDEETPEVEH